MDCCRTPVVIRGAQFQGELQHVMHLPGAYHRPHLEAHLRSGQLLVSPEGLDAARFVPVGENGLQIERGGQMMPHSFDSDPLASASTAARLLELQGGKLLVFGTHSSGLTGVFLLRGGHVELLTPADEFLGVQYTRDGALVFVRSRDDDPEMVRVCASFLPNHSPITDPFTIHRSAQVCVLAGGTLLVLEPINLGRYGIHLHRYTVHRSRGFRDMSLVPVAPGEKVVGLVRWHDVCLLGVRGPAGSLFRNLGPESRHMLQRRVPVFGELEELWPSPTGESFAWVARIIGDNGHMQRQFGVNNLIIHTSDFTTGRFDLVWSPDGRHAALRIRVGTAPNEVEHLISSGSRVRISLGYHAQEFCVNNQGQIVAWIQTDGRFSEPIIRWKPHDGVELAWNLVLEPDGTISFNRVLADVIMKVSDRTHLAR